MPAKALGNDETLNRKLGDNESRLMSAVRKRFGDTAAKAVYCVVAKQITELPAFLPSEQLNAIRDLAVEHGVQL